MKRTGIITALVIFFIGSLSLFSSEIEYDSLFGSPGNQKLSLADKYNNFSLVQFNDIKIPTSVIRLNRENRLATDNFIQATKDVTSNFNLGINDSQAFSLSITPDIFSRTKNKKYYSKTAVQITEINAFVWAFNKYILKENWTKISLKSILRNLRLGYAWDIDTFKTNQFGHPYHGATYYSAARANGFNFLESSIFTFLGSFSWETFFEAITPSKNDLIMTTLGGITLGEALFRIADLVLDESSTGFERALKESLAFIINPAYGFRFFSEKPSEIGYSPEKHYYSLDMPFGTYKSSTAGHSFMVAANLEYKDFLRNSILEVNPYDWFTLDARLGLLDDGLIDKEIFTTGILFGRKIKNGLAGLFGVFDYIDSHTADKMSAVGVGPGLVTSVDSDSDLFFNSSGVLSFIFGGTSPSFELEDYHFGKLKNEPYYLGPGLLGKVKLELGKKGLGSIYTAFSRYWVNSMLYEARESLTISSFSFKYDLSSKSQISFGYDYYLRHASHYEQHFAGARYGIRALYVLKF